MPLSRSSFSVRVVNTDPPLVSDGKRRYSLEGGATGLTCGDWLHVSGLPSGGVRFLAVDQPTDCEFPGPEWARMQYPLNGPTRMDALRFRAELTRETRAYFWSLGHMEVETPVRVPSPGVETHLTAMGADGWFLSPSPEFQMKRLLAAGSGSIFQLQKCFRGAEHGHRHNSEFTMLEWYTVGADAEALMAETEGLVGHLMERLDRPVVPPPPFARLTMAEAFATFAGVPDYRADADTLYRQAGLEHLAGKGHSWEEAFFTVLAEVCEPAFADYGPLFLTHWPMEFASLSRPSRENPREADRFELYAGGLELANGFVELTDHAQQRARSEADLVERRESQKPLYPLDERFLSALAEGMPSTAGIALGMDRVAMLLWGTLDIATTLTFSEDEL